MQFLWKSQLRKERGKLLPKNPQLKNKTSRKEKLELHTGCQNSYFGVVFLWLLFFGTLIYVAFFSPYLSITAVNISGAPDEEIQSVDHFVNESIAGKYFFVFPKNDFFFVLPKRLEKRIQNEYPLVRTVAVKRVFPHTLEIKIVAREKLVLWCAGSTCSHLLEDGSVVPVSEVFQKDVNKNQTLTIRDTSEKSLPLGAGVFPEDFVPFVVSLPENLMSRLGVEIENSFTVSSRFADELRLKTKEGWEIYLSTERPIDISLNALGLVLDKEIGDKRASLKYIDLRTENRIYYVFQEGTSPSGEMTLAEGEEKKTEKRETEKSKKK